MHVFVPAFLCRIFSELKNEVLTLSVLKDIIKLYYTEEEQYEKIFD